MRFDEYSYGPIAGVYDALAGIYSCGRIAASKRIQLEMISRGDCVLYAGVGRGEDALLAARVGARVTAIDVAGPMLERLSQRLGRDGLSCELIQADVATHETPDPYDIVVANYFLNLFEAERASEMLRHLARLLKPEGRLLITDFAQPEGGLFARGLTELYYRPINWIAWVLGFCALHPILDYRRMLETIGFQVESERRLPVLAGANPAYVSIVARRRE